MARRMLGEPLDDIRHSLLEVARHREVEHPRTDGPAVLEVVRYSARNKDERASGSIGPAIADEEAHGSLEDEEDVVLGVGMGPGPCVFGASHHSEIE
jgi:hypothetical protein